MNAPTTLRLRDGAFIAPTEITYPSASQSVKLCFASVTPLRKCFRFAMYRNQPIHASVVYLLGPSGPSAILFAVWAIVINAINRMIVGRWFSHVSIEVLKRLSPSVANTNTATTVILKRTITWSIASVQHMNPRPMSFSMRHSVDSGFLSPHCNCLAPTRFCQTAKQASAVSDKSVPAMTPPSKHSLPVANFYESFADYPAKHLASHVNKASSLASATLNVASRNTGENCFEPSPTMASKVPKKARSFTIQTSPQTRNSVYDLSSVIFNLFFLRHTSARFSSCCFHIMELSRELFSAMTQKSMLFVTSRKGIVHSNASNAVENLVRVVYDLVSHLMLLESVELVEGRADRNSARPSSFYSL
jgi:hypothetical protein